MKISSPVLCIDMGGTWTRWSLLTDIDSFLKSDWKQVDVFETQKGVPGFLNNLKQIDSGIRQMGDVFERNQQLYFQGHPIRVSLSMPGHTHLCIVQDFDIPRNLEAFRDEFKGLNLSNICQNVFAKKTQVSIHNDASSQAIGGFELALSSGVNLKEGKWMYLGLGTGLGAAFYEWDGSNHIQIGPSHISDLLLYNTAKELVEVESICSGSYFNHQVRDINSSKPYSESFRQVVYNMCDTLVELLIKINQGAFKTSSNQWSRDDQGSLQGINQLLLGGGLTKAEFFIELAVPYLKSQIAIRGIQMNLHLIQDPLKAALLGSLLKG